MNFEFATATRIVCGNGSLRELPALASGFGRRTLLVTGRDAGRAVRVIELLKSSGVSVVSFSVSGEPTIETVEHGVALAKSEGVEVVVAFGGGSVLDAAKAIAAMLTNEGALLDYLDVIGGGKALGKPSAPFIAIPTTAGTGSEVTRNSVLASPEHRVKVSLRSGLMLAKVAIVDPELTYDLTPALTASTGLDALTQLIEPYTCNRANPMTDGLCVEGMKRAARSLRVAFADGKNAAAREDMAVASLFGGLALANAGLGAVHGFSGPVGGMFPAPHGAVCAALLPHVMAANIRALRRAKADRQVGPTDPAVVVLWRYEDVARLLTENAQASADDGVEWVRKLVADLQIPLLRTYGVTKEHVAELVEKSRAASSMKANPIALTSEELAETLERAT